MVSTAFAPCNRAFQKPSAYHPIHGQLHIDDFTIILCSIAMHDGGNQLKEAANSTLSKTRPCINDGIRLSMATNESVEIRCAATHSKVYTQHTKRTLL